MLTSSDAADPLPADAQPELRCPLCDYNLRGLIDPRCPECGYAADSWEEMYRLSAQTHPFLFEHHPERNLTSRMQTWSNGLNPWRFWTSLRPEHRIDLGRIVRYWIVFVPILMLPGLIMYGNVAVALDAQNKRQAEQFIASINRNVPGNAEHRARMIRMFGSIEAAKDAIYPRLGTWPFFRRTLQEAPAAAFLVPLTLFVCVWPWLVVPAMSCFAVTLRRARIRPAQILRCAVYSWDIVVLAGALFLLATIWQLFIVPPAPILPGWTPPPWQAWQRTTMQWIGPVTLLVALLITLRLGVAFGRYLRLRHALMTALLVQVVLGLLCAKFMFVLWGF